MTKLTEGVVVRITNWNGIEVLWSYSYPFKTVNGEPAFLLMPYWLLKLLSLLNVLLQHKPSRAQTLKWYGFWWDMASHLDHSVSNTMCVCVRVREILCCINKWICMRLSFHVRLKFPLRKISWSGWKG